MIEYMILNNTGDIKRDVVDTLNTFSSDDINSMIFDFYRGQGICFLYKNDYDLVSTFQDKKAIYDRGYRVSLTDLLYSIASYNDDRYSNLINKFNNSNVYALLVGKDEIDVSFINLCFQVLSSDDMYNKFLDFDNNKNLFSFNGSYNQEHYLLEMMRYFDDNKNLVMIKNIQFNFDFVSKQMMERFNKLKSFIDISDKIYDTEFSVSDGFVNSYHKQKYMDNEWKLDKSIEDYVFGGLNSSYSLEEKIAYIYLKMCLLFEYEGSYMVDMSVNSLYSKEIMESINVNNPNILCSDFAHIFTKLVNRLDGVDARSVRCGKGSRVHEYIALLIKDKNIRIDFDPIDVKESFNDLTSAKLGIRLSGVSYVNDSESIFRNAFEKVYQELLSQKVITTYDLVKEYEASYFNDIGVDYGANMSSFLDEMKKKKIRGSELIITFMRMQSVGYFGNINYSLAFYRHDDGYMERLIIFESNNSLYYFRTSTQEIISVTREQLNNLFSENILTYEDDKYMLEGVGISK